MKKLFYILLVFLTSCRLANDYMSKESRFFGKMGLRDTIQVVEEANDCEDGPFTHLYKIYNHLESNSLRCSHTMREGWGNVNTPIIKRNTYVLSDKSLWYYLNFEKDIVNQNIGEGIAYSTWHSYQIILNDDTISTDIVDQRYTGFGEFIMSLEEITE